MPADPILVVDNLVRDFKALRALDGVSLELGPGQVLGLLGPNGSGKTTMINVVSGIYRPTSGTVTFRGRTVDGLPPHRRVRLGMNRTFQVPKPFSDLTVLENVTVAWRNGGRSHGDLEEALTMVGLQDRRNRLARSLNLTEQKLLDLARALATNPQLLMVDELGAGLNPTEFAEVADKLHRVAERGTSLLIVEHLMGFLQRITKRVVVLHLGRVIFTGSLTDALKDTQVIKVFIGE